MSYKEDILRLRNEGKSYGEISETLGCSKGTVAYYLKEKQDTPTTLQTNDQPVAAWSHKVLSYIDNFKIKRPCLSCGQYLHPSQLDPANNEDVNSIVSSVSDKETFEESKRKISQLKFICANCDRLRQFKQSI
jgi:hypothetical protein